MMIKTTKLYILVSVWMAFTFIQCHSGVRNKKIGVHSYAELDIDVDEIQYVAITCWCVEAQAKFILHKYHSRERTLLTRLFGICNIVRCWDTCEPICLRLGMMLTLFNSTV